MNVFAVFENPRALAPLDLTDGANWPFAVAFLFAFLLVRYFLISLPFAISYVPGIFRRFGARRIYASPPPVSQQAREILWSLSTTAVFALVTVAWGWAWQSGMLRLYNKYDEYGWLYLALVSPLALLALHETYFYWTHRWLHSGWAYRRLHWVHHRSQEPSAWAAFSFHPAEALINALALPLITLVLPLHPVVLLAHLMLMTVTAATNHWGIEVLPSVVARSRLGEWVISGVHHVEHHRRMRWNYGLFVTVWDVWMSTERADHRERLAQRFTPKLSAVFVLAFLGLSSARVDAQVDPKGVLTAPEDARLDLRLAYSSAKTSILARAPALSQIERAKPADEEGATAEILIWETAKLGQATWLRARMRAGDWVWILKRPKWKYTSLEDSLKSRTFSLKRDWDRKTRAGPLSDEVQLFEEAPETLRFSSFVVFSAATAGADRIKFELFESPEGRRLASRDPSVDWESAGALLVSDSRGEASDGRTQVRVFVYGRDGDWLKLRARAQPPYVERWAWIRGGVVGLEAKEFESEGERQAAIDAVPELASLRRPHLDGFDARVVNFQEVQGRAWGLLEVHREDLCASGSAPAPAARGWVPIFESDGSGMTGRVRECD